MTILCYWGACYLSCRCTPWSRLDRKWLHALPYHSNGHHGHAPLRAAHDYSLSARPIAHEMEFNARSLLHCQTSLPTTGEHPHLADESMGPTWVGRINMALSSRQGPSTQCYSGSNSWWARDWRCLWQSGPQAHRGTTWPTV